jgi:thymidylate synthase (FAD)
VAISQESLRFVRLTEIPFEHPSFIRENETLLAAANRLLAQMESFQELVATATGIDGENVPFSTKKSVTSGARRYAPDGVATAVGWTANIRAVRHIVTMRTDPSAEAEIRRVFDKVGQLMARELPSLFSDFVRAEDGTWRPAHEKV